VNQAIQDFIDCKRIAVVGVSCSSQKFGNTAFAELKSRGYQVYPCNPAATQIAGERCYPDLSNLTGQIDSVLIIVPSTRALQVLHEAASLGLNKVWAAAKSRVARNAQPGKRAGSCTGQREMHPGVCAAGALIPRLASWLLQIGW
jgi:predicted CoA-binding protein